jgi:hypothetical protein
MKPGQSFRRILPAARGANPLAKLSFASLALLGMALGSAQAATMSWIGADGAWETDANWVSNDTVPVNRVPIAGDGVNVLDVGTVRVSPVTGRVPASGNLGAINIKGTNRAVIQTGGEVYSNANMWIGSTGGGTYELQDGTLTLTSGLDISGINVSGQIGYFIQSGGTATVNSVRMNYKGTGGAYIEVTDGELNVSGTLTMAYGGATDIAWLTQSGGKVTINNQLQMGTASAVSGVGSVIVNLDGGEMTIKGAAPLSFVGGTTNYFDFNGGTLNLRGTWDFASLTGLANADFRVDGLPVTAADLAFVPITIDSLAYTQISLSDPGDVPEIAVEQPLGTNVPFGSTKDFRWVAVGSHTDLVFTIKNTGTADLTGLTITKDGTNAADFTVISDPTAPVAGPDGSTTFTVRFAPAAPGARSAAIHIANNDSNENPFHINLTGIGTTSTDRQSGALRIFLLAGQSNMEGQAYAFDSAATATWNVPTMEFLLSGTAAATNYLANMPFGFKTSLKPDWLLPRNDAWAVHYNSSTGAVKEVLPTNNQADILSGIQLLGPGFGVGTGNGAMIGPELAMGIRLADATGDPVFLFKSSMGGTTLGNDWRPPAAVAARGGSVGVNYTNTVNRFREFLDALDADLADDGKLNGYNNATSYKVSGVVWFQGWNEQYDDAPYTAAQLQAEYKDNLKDLIHSLRAADTRMPADLPLIIPESSDQNANLNAGRVAAVAELNAGIANTAVYIENNEMIGTFWGNNELGVPFSTGAGYHFNARAENFLEVGWRIGGAALANGYIRSSNSATVAQALTGPGGPFEGQTDPDVVGFAANPDGDRWVNAVEVLLGFNPAVADGAMPMTTSFANDGANTYLEVHVTVDAAMDDLMTWHLEFSSDLENWTESSNPRTIVGESGSLRTIAIRDGQAVGTTPGRFYRIKLLAGE